MFDISSLNLTILKSDSFVWKEQSKLRTEVELFLAQKKDFEKEKQQFMEAVCRLDREVNLRNLCFQKLWLIIIVLVVVRLVWTSMLSTIVGCVINGLHSML